MRFRAAFAASLATRGQPRAPERQRTSFTKVSLGLFPLCNPLRSALIHALDSVVAEGAARQVLGASQARQ